MLSNLFYMYRQTYFGSIRKKALMLSLLECLPDQSLLTSYVTGLVTNDSRVARLIFILVCTVSCHFCSSFKLIVNTIKSAINQKALYHSVYYIALLFLCCLQTTYIWKPLQYCKTSLRDKRLKYPNINHWKTRNS